jgi:hypothetical protein
VTLVATMIVGGFGHPRQSVLRVALSAAVMANGGTSAVTWAKATAGAHRGVFQQGSV